MGTKKEKTVLKITGLRHAASAPADLKDLAARELGVSGTEILRLQILRRATDARQKRIDFVYTVLATLQVEKQALAEIIKKKNVTCYSERDVQKTSPAVRMRHQPVIIGSGPSGLFAALTLVERGIPPLVIEQGQRIPEREKSVEAFWNKGILNTASNVLFGEGGAGTFSDGKLTTRIKSPLKEKVLAALISHGAPAEIMYMHKPHIGTDRLRNIIPALVSELERKGAAFLFNTRMTDIDIARGRVCGITAGTALKTGLVFLAAGHSARDLYRLLNTKGVRLAGKDFSVGVRIEHPQEFINRRLIRSGEDHTDIGPADYFMACKDSQTGRGVYSFCMCPGGYIIGCSSEKNGLCTNGMSAWRRNSAWANAALVVSVGAGDFGVHNPLGGLQFQETIENCAFTAGGGGFSAPALTAADFVKEPPPEACAAITSCSYRPSVTLYDLKKILPEFIRLPLLRGFKVFNKKMPGFIEEGVLVGVETRTSSPVRILRDAGNFHAPGIHGLIPIGEGSGYAGGIMSSAVDGIRAAQGFDR